ncbi:MAG: glycosyltransferase family 2 protein [Deltaproteobacteria bacterium]|nr:glycosyltransferase family 2 protein [Deltaproteobacteria bacterium]
MELSILIPIFNWDVTGLVSSLAAEIRRGVPCPVEIVAMDDCSTDQGAKETNRAACARLKAEGVPIDYEELAANIGRAAIRNRLVAASDGTHLLFLDCDVVPDREDFLSNYYQAITENAADVVVGGKSYVRRIMAGKEYDFHVYWSETSEALPAAARNRKPALYVVTSNVVVSRKVFEAFPFADRFAGWGYEDTEWGMRLANGCRITHIDNQVSHLGLVSKEAFYRRMRKSVANCLLLAELQPAGFKTMNVYPYARLFSRLGRRSLKVLDVVLRGLFLLQDVHQASNLIAYQLDKAVLLAMALKDKDRSDTK